ncbi:unknown [Crocosphaera subtropica ATCC 51142]|uniref:YcfA-like protein n=1 Tax=Crocosphaera subtropica (strain ATCC 51142 / BH68) TaxID=43989 RepID=B1WXB0_CROS5|nr:type II toxin-antitoxin system HicA family toxin [Crocosphaera subtropica]ACB50854.1 unknown [Crocosphaera subtropica ATCC 51142]
MPKLPRLTAKEAEKLLFDADFILLRTQGSHRIYLKNEIRVVVPFHSGKIRHPKITKQVIKAIEETNQ